MLRRAGYLERGQALWAPRGNQVVIVHPGSSHFRFGSRERHEVTVSQDGRAVPVGGRHDNLADVQSVEHRVAFQFERELEDFLVFNWLRIELFADYDIFGRQYSADTGKIDILALSKDKNRWLVIELKRGKPRDEAVGQVLRYMGWVERVLAKSGQRLRDTLKFTKKDTVNFRSYRVNIELF